MNKTGIARSLATVVTALLIAGAAVIAVPGAASAATPTGPQYSYQMVNVYKSGARVKGAQISYQVCAPTSNATTASYNTSTTRSNTFSITSDLSFSGLSGLLSSKVSVSGGVTTSTTTTEGLGTVVPQGRCMAVFALNDVYRYTLQKKCNWACSGAYASKSWVTVGTGSYTKFVGRAYFYTY
ncbi:hypothetical protein [Microbacterium sp. E-13]|uniref:hypothetical protein n=1 Tax=Microbacterium sp. E-13 TaxID=3404048 RepID=UPI003CE6E142